MKTIQLTILFFLYALLAKAQEEYKHSLNGIKKVNIETRAHIEITAGLSNEVIISSNYSNNNKDKSKGLRPVYANGIDNTGYGLQVEKEGDVLEIKDLKMFKNSYKLLIQLPKHIDLYLNCLVFGNAKIIGLTSEIEVNSGAAHIDLTKVTGPLTINTASGNINAKFSIIDQNTPIYISTATGDVDVSIPSKTSANLELKTGGTIYTDFRSIGTSGDSFDKGSIKLNNGGVRIELRSGIGNIYLRKINNN